MYPLIPNRIKSSFKVTKDDIGKEFYPVDNSYSQDLTTGLEVDCNEGYGLARTMIDIKSVKVKIISEPLIMTQYSNVIEKEHINEFVIVEYKDKKYLVLNLFN